MLEDSLRRRMDSKRCPNKEGSTVTVDIPAIRAALLSDGRAIISVEMDAGISNGALHKVIRRGRCKMVLADGLALALGQPVDSILEMKQHA